MNIVNDDGMGYSVSRKLTALSEMIGDIIRSQKAGARVVNRLFSPDEQPTDSNIRERLREALSYDNALDLTAAQKRSLLAAFQLSQYLYKEDFPQGEVIDSPGIAAKAFQRIAYARVEKFAVLVMDVKHRVLSLKIVSSGTPTETLAHPAEIFRTVLQAGGVRCIVAHNHPSGSVEPSKEDLVLTKQLLGVSKALFIPMMDHLIVARGDHASIRQTTDLWSEM